MENEFFLNAGIAPLLHFEPSNPMPNWQPVSGGLEMQAMEMNCSSEKSPDCFYNPNWEKSTDQSVQFESALSSIVSSPVASNSNISNESFVIRELIGKLGNIGSSGEISPHSRALMGGVSSYINGGNSANTSCYSTPLNSPPKINLPVIDHLVKEKIPSLGKSMPLNSTLAEFSADPGFAARAARFSCFGSRSFNGRMNQFGSNNSELPNGPYPLPGNSKMPRISSSPSLKALGSQMGIQENKNSKTGLANSQEVSTLSEQNPNGETGLKASNEMNSRKRKTASRGKSKEPASNSTKVAETNENSNSKRSKQTENENGPAKTEEETQDNNGEEKQTKSSPKPPEPPKDYIHVRARRGQATDSHSLAERVRREKISERMKLLQDLVPGCNKVTGKALMLDEIINYVQSLQRQVEFLSMKLSSVNTRLDINMGALMSKDIFQQNNTMAHPIFPLDSSAQAIYGHHQTQQNTPIHNISSGPHTHSMDPLDSSMCQNPGMQLAHPNGFSDVVSHQYPAFGEDDLQTLVQMGLNGPNQESLMKVEL
ncbi:hypothetical protein UlMin_031929 [Ulmus minor]